MTTSTFQINNYFSIKWIHGMVSLLYIFNVWNLLNFIEIFLLNLKIAWYFSIELIYCIDPYFCQLRLLGSSGDIGDHCVWDLNRIEYTGKNKKKKYWECFKAIGGVEVQILHMSLF